MSSDNVQRGGRKIKIGELATRAGVSPATVRYYESLSLMPVPHREANGYRRYGEDAFERLSFIRDAQASGLSLTEIASILELRESGEATCEHVVRLLERHVEEMDEQIQALRSARALLVEMAARARGLDPAACTDPIRCQTIEAATG